MGVGFGYSEIAYASALKGISKLQTNPETIAKDLDQAWEVLAEPIQTVMRRYHIEEPYEKLKALTRGQSINKDTLATFINALDIPEQAKLSLLAMTPSSYIGNAVELAENVESFIKQLEI